MASATRRTSSASSSAEKSRQREFDKHYQPWSDYRTLNAVPADTGPDGSPKLTRSPDTLLTAFAQLAALRLKVKRGMVSLIDTRTQIILAETTQTVSLIDESRHAPGDHIWLGNVSLPRADCMDEHVLTNTTLFHQDDGQEVEIPSFIVPDTLEDDRFKERPYVTSGLSVRFYAGVPIVTKQGHAIGAYAVSDVQPRPDGLTLDEAMFMIDVAQSIAEHLDAVMGTVGRVSEREFVRGVSRFLEDLSEFKFNLSNVDHSKPSGPSQSSDTRATDPQTTPKEERQSSLGSEAISKTGSSSQDQDMDAPVESRNDNRPPRFSRSTTKSYRDGTASSQENVRRIFVKASQLICEQTRAKGCLFVSAALSQPSNGTAPLGRIDPWATLDIDQETEQEQADNSIPGATASVRLGNVESSSGIISRSSLRKCIMRYPFGKCFLLNHGKILTDGTLYGDEESIIGGGSSHSSSDQVARLHNQTALVLPPEWSAAGFIWGTDFKMGDPSSSLPYLKTLGSCMMSEVASMDVLNTNIAKSTFIASISHDLRSPLHGLLGNMEFLEDTLTTAYQMSLIGAIETCGKTLLDTIDHLLEYAKINNLRWTSQPTDDQKQPGIGRNSSQASSTTVFDLSVLLEEVVEAVFAGQTFRKMDVRNHDLIDDANEQIKAISLDDITPLDEIIPEGSAKFSGKVSLVMDIEKRSWCVQGHAGALRRIIMNVVGNAIKYCQEGYIEISLKAKEVNSTGIKADIMIKDTGIGMSQDFLANHLFKPFSQEDSFATGTGLGLSITSQIVSSLNGSIKVASEKGVGTHVNIMIPLEVVPPLTYDSQYLDVVQITRGKKVCFLDPTKRKKSLKKKQYSKLESSVATTFQEWLGLQVERCEAITHADLDTAIYIYAEPPPIEQLVDHHLHRTKQGIKAREAALLIICTNAFEAAALRAAGVKKLTSLGRIVEVICQPVGVRKLAKVLKQCLRRLEYESQDSTEQAVDTSFLLAPNLTNREVQEKAADIKWNASSVIYDTISAQHRPSIDSLKWKSDPSDPERNRITRFKPEMNTLVAQEPSSAVSSLPTEHPKAKKRPRVLLVDDNTINLRLLVTFVRKINLSYAEAINGLEAFNKFKGTEVPYDVVLMDLQMPVMDGLESTRRIREYEQSRGADPARIIAITGVGNDSTRQEALDAGMSEYLTKPVRFNLLQQLLLQES
ncbi:hypothetical protein F5Y16DRAFT_411843 [Xylariaceae sp. FL0255]|nr:hypothetical protein F5Y16DRAFT_411843 [Xylariaceae sp. FL0255]